MHFEPLFFLLWALQCLGRWGNNENPVDPNSTQGTLLWPPVHHSSAAGSSVGPCTGASPPLWRGPPDLISMTQVTCVNLIRMNIYDVTAPDFHGAREPGLRVILALVTCGACGEHSPGNPAFGVFDSLFLGVSSPPASPSLLTPQWGRGGARADRHTGFLTVLPPALVCSPLTSKYFSKMQTWESPPCFTSLSDSHCPRGALLPSLLTLSTSPTTQDQWGWPPSCLGTCAPSQASSTPVATLNSVLPGESWMHLFAPLRAPQTSSNPEGHWPPSASVSSWWGPSPVYPQGSPWMVVPPHTSPWRRALGCGNSSQSAPTLICLTALLIHPSLQDQDVHVTPVLWTDLALIQMQINQLHISLYETLGKLECWIFYQMNEIEL